jgi:hypothetical protein
MLKVGATGIEEEEDMLSKGIKVLVSLLNSINWRANEDGKTANHLHYCMNSKVHVDSIHLAPTQTNTLQNRGMQISLKLKSI